MSIEGIALLIVLAVQAVVSLLRARVDKLKRDDFKQLEAAKSTLSDKNLALERKVMSLEDRVEELEYELHDTIDADAED